jgi:hypothetical protein
MCVIFSQSAPEFARPSWQTDDNKHHLNKYRSERPRHAIKWPAKTPSGCNTLRDPAWARRHATKIMLGYGDFGNRVTTVCMPSSFPRHQDQTRAPICLVNVAGSTSAACQCPEIDNMLPNSARVQGARRPRISMAAKISGLAKTPLRRLAVASAGAPGKGP